MAIIEIFEPILSILPEAQKIIWAELSTTPEHFILYGGTAIALYLGHRNSVDFDFFSTQPFQPNSLLNTIPYLNNAILQQSAANTLTCFVSRGAPVQLSFFGGLKTGQIVPHKVANGTYIKVASLIDLAGMKMAVITQRAEVKDYLDIHALIMTANISLPEMLAAAKIQYGVQFSPLLSLKALSYHDDPALESLPNAVRKDLVNAIQKVDIRKLPSIDYIRSFGG